MRRTFFTLSSSTALRPCLVTIESSVGSRVVNLSFCLGVRSPWRVRATTHSSSPSSSLARLTKGPPSSAAADGIAYSPPCAYLPTQ